MVISGYDSNFMLKNNALTEKMHILIRQSYCCYYYHCYIIMSCLTA